MESLEAERERAESLDVGELADAIEAIGFECTRCGACCKAVDGCEGGDADEEGADTGGEGHDHTATVFPDEVRELQATDDYDWRDVARPMPYGLVEGEDGSQGETFEWALATDDCGDCTFYAEDDGVGACTVHGDRPLVCRTYPFSVALGGTSQPMGEAVDEEGMVRAHECEGLGRDISREEAEELARALKERAIRELDEAVAVRDSYRPVERDSGEVVVFDSEGPKRPDGSAIE
jgi:Fe-S-cluster containining protein